MVSKEFSDAVEREIKNIMGDNLDEVIIRPLLKNNDVELTSCTVRLTTDEEMCPVAYLEQYEELNPHEAAVKLLQDIYGRRINMNIVTDEIMNFEKAKHRICMRLVNRTMNKKFLKNSIHKDYLDLSITLYLDLGSDEQTSRTVRLTKDLLGTWGITEDEAFALARENTARINPQSLKSMVDVMKNMLRLDGMPEEVIDAILFQNNNNEMEVYILSNQSGVFGATAILYPDVLSEFAIKHQTEELTLIPSSIHEVILVPGHLDKNEIAKMIGEVNTTQVAANEILSEHPYYYNLTLDTVF